MKKQPSKAAEKKAAAARSAARIAKERELWKAKAKEARAEARKKKKKPPRQNPLDQVYGVLRSLRESVTAIQASQANISRELPNTLAGVHTFVSWRATIPPNSSHTFEAMSHWETFRPTRLVLSTPTPGIMVQAIDLGGAEQLTHPTPAELFHVAATPENPFLEDNQLDVFGPGDTITVRNVTADPLDCGVGLSGIIETDRVRARRWQRIAERLRAELNRTPAAVAVEPSSEAADRLYDAAVRAQGRFDEPS